MIYGQKGTDFKYEIKEADGKPDFFTFKIGDEPFALVKTDEGFSLVVGVCPEDK